MTRKDYKLIADVFALHNAFGRQFPRVAGAWRLTANRELAARMADALAADNPHFDHAKFMQACRVNQ